MKLLVIAIFGISWFTFVYCADKRFRIIPMAIHFVLLCVFIASALTFFLPLIFGVTGITIAKAATQAISQWIEFFGIGMMLLLPFPASFINRIEKRRTLIASLVIMGIGAFCLSWIFYAFYDFYGGK